jgi:hypothetical protein
VSAPTIPGVKPEGAKAHVDPTTGYQGARWMPDWAPAAEPCMGRKGLNHCGQAPTAKARQLRVGPKASKEHTTKGALRVLDAERETLGITLKDTSRKDIHAGKTTKNTKLVEKNKKQKKKKKFWNKKMKKKREFIQNKKYIATQKHIYIKKTRYF